jgi:uncharacterized protein (TIGR03382 family)
MQSWFVLVIIPPLAAIALVCVAWWAMRRRRK